MTGIFQPDIVTDNNKIIAKLANLRTTVKTENGDGTDEKGRTTICFNMEINEINVTDNMRVHYDMSLLDENGNKVNSPAERFTGIFFLLKNSKKEYYGETYIEKMLNIETVQKVVMFVGKSVKID